MPADLIDVNGQPQQIQNVPPSKVTMGQFLVPGSMAYAAGVNDVTLITPLPANRADNVFVGGFVASQANGLYVQGCAVTGTGTGENPFELHAYVYNPDTNPHTLDLTYAVLESPPRPVT